MMKKLTLGLLFFSFVSGSIFAQPKNNPGNVFQWAYRKGSALFEPLNGGSQPAKVSVEGSANESVFTEEQIGNKVDSSVVSTENTFTAPFKNAWSKLKTTFAFNKGDAFTQFLNNGSKKVQSGIQWTTDSIVSGYNTVRENTVDNEAFVKNTPKAISSAAFVAGGLYMLFKTGSNLCNKEKSWSECALPLLASLGCMTAAYGIGGDLVFNA